jgi:hypothetical protein
MAMEMETETEAAVMTGMTEAAEMAEMVKEATEISADMEVEQIKGMDGEEMLFDNGRTVNGSDCRKYLT